MEGDCHESGRMLVYQWKFSEFQEQCSVMSEMSEFMGLKAFRFALKRVGSGEKSKTVIYFIAANLHKTGVKVDKVSVKIKGQPHSDAQMKARDNELNYLQLFIKEFDYDWLEEDVKSVTFTFHVHIVEILTHYRYQLTDVLFMDQLWMAACNKQWTDIEFVVKNHVFAAHRIVLAARSPVFVTVEHMVPGSRIKIDCSDPITFESFLKFIYTGVFQVTKSRQINEGVLRLADLYQLTTLKSLCQLAIQHIDANHLTALAMSMKPDFEYCPKKPQLNGKGKAQSKLFFKKFYTVIECVWRIEDLPDVDQVFTSDLLNFRTDGAFRAGLADHPIANHSTLLSPKNFLYLACSHLEKTGTVVYHVDSSINGTDCCRMDRRGERALHVFGRELYDLVAPSSFKFDIMIKETVGNYSYQIYDNLRSSDFWSIFKEGVLTDIEFQVGELNFLAHRAIVASRSPVFATLFGSSTVESVTGRIRIDDVEPSVFREFLFFLYTGTLQVSADCQALLNIAEQYKIETLIQICRAAIQDVDIEEISTSLIWL